MAAIKNILILCREKENFPWNLTDVLFANIIYITINQLKGGVKHERRKLQTKDAGYYGGSL